VLGTSYYVPTHSIRGLKGGPIFGKERVLRHGLHFPRLQGAYRSTGLDVGSWKGLYWHNWLPAMPSRQCQLARPSILNSLDLTQHRIKSYHLPRPSSTTRCCPSSVTSLSAFLVLLSTHAFALFRPQKPCPLRTWVETFHVIFGLDNISFSLPLNMPSDSSALID